MKTLAAIVACAACFLAGCQQDQVDHSRVQNGILQKPVVAGQTRSSDDSPRPQASASQKAPSSANAAPNARAQQSPPSGPVAAGIPKSWYPSAKPRAWKYIVIHHSDTEVGSATSFDRYHRQVRHWASLGYDFVIDNGHGAADGLVEAGPRWKNQETGAHAGVLEYNEYGIGICLVGDFQTGRPTAAQLKSLAKLNAFLMRTYRIPTKNIIGHRDCKRGHTNCPGKNMDIALVQAMSTRLALGDNSVLGDALATLTTPSWDQ